MVKETGEIMEWLEDDESKFIYQKRLEYNKTGNFSAIKEIAEQYVPELPCYYPEIINELVNFLVDKTRIVLWGSGIRAKNLLGILNRNNIKVDWLVDNNVDKWGGEYKWN